MRKYALLLAFAAVMVQPLAAMADDDVTTVEKTQVETETKADSNPLTEVIIFPVRLVTGVIGAPIGAVGGLFTGFVKGFNLPGGTRTEARAQRTTTTTSD